jgi:uncharacterized protein YggT (Ycf19 family)
MNLLGASLALAVALWAAVLGFLFAARFLVSFWPGGLFLALRRRLFLWTQPWLEPVSGWFSFRLGTMDWTPLAAAAVCWMVIRALVPWLFLLGYRLSVG